MSVDGLRHLAHREHSDIDGVEPVQRTRKLKGLTTASGRNALRCSRASDFLNVLQFCPP